MKEDLSIQFSGLIDGFHDFHFEVGNTFFEQLDYSEIQKASLLVDIRLEKRINMMILNFEVSGNVEVMCDRCTDDFFLEVKLQDELIYKFGEEISIDEKIIVLSEKEIEIDISQPIYEFVAIAIPSKRMHAKGECNQEMLEKMDNYLMIESDDATKSNEASEEKSSDTEQTDPRWSELKKLKK
jgi:DUF177 domain-containing protein